MTSKKTFSSNNVYYEINNKNKFYLETGSVVDTVKAMWLLSIKLTKCDQRVVATQGSANLYAQENPSIHIPATVLLRCHEIKRKIHAMTDCREEEKDLTKNGG